MPYMAMENLLIYVQIFFSYTEDLLEKLITIGAFIEVFK